MSALTEIEIFDCMKSNLKAAADRCDLIAKFPQSGPQFDEMRKSLKLVEGACRQAAAWREDARWLNYGIIMEQAHQKARGWLHRPTVSSKKLFTLLAAALRKNLADMERMQTMATHRLGMILPTPQDGPQRNAFIQVPRVTPGGLLLPASIH